MLDENGGGEDAECSPQTVAHRLNVLSQVFKKWGLAHDQIINTPVGEDVRPGLPGDRDGRLLEGREWRLVERFQPEQNQSRDSL